MKSQQNIQQTTGNTDPLHLNAVNCTDKTEPGGTAEHSLHSSHSQSNCEEPGTVLEGRNRAANYTDTSSLVRLLASVGRWVIHKIIA